MGMFDEITCLYPLPDGLPPGERFQTKDLDCVLAKYTITAEGRLQDESGSEDLSNYSGSIRMYWSNLVASGPGYYTETGEDAHFLEYRITFVGGSVVRVEVLRNEYQAALESAKLPFWKTPSDKEKRQSAERRREHLTGRTMWVWKGLHPTGYAVKVIAENDRDWVVQAEDQSFEIVHRSSRDQTLFDSQEEGLRDKNERTADWDRRRKEYDDAVQARAERMRSDDPAPH